MLHSDVDHLIAAGLLQVTVARVGHIIGAADGIGSQWTIFWTLTLSLAFGHYARPAVRAVSLLTNF